ncbi:MAG: PQQ-binding-like beta-propeller repeat protein [bacterium]|nr:PQQ-binding-like beta-propeller repeat protein [bacterium]
MKILFPLVLYGSLLGSLFVSRLPIAACQESTSNTVEAAGPDMDYQAWWQAAQSGDAAEIKRLLALGVPVDQQTEYGATALMFAAGRGHAEVVRILLEAGAEPNLKDRFYSASPMGWAAMKRHAAVAVVLVESGSRDTDAAMSMAVQANDFRALELLVARIQPDESALRKLKAQLPQGASVELVNFFSGVPDPAPQATAKTSEVWNPDPRQLELYAGRYTPNSSSKAPNDEDSNTVPDTDQQVLKVFVADDQLMLETEQAVALKPISTDTFQFGEATMSFRIQDQRVLELIIEGDNRATYIPVLPLDTVSPSRQTSQRDLSDSSQNWMQFRGQNARGVAEGQAPPVHWNVPEGKNVLWKRPIPGLAHSCPIVVDNKIFLTTAISQGEDAGLRNGLYGDVDSVEDSSPHSFEVICLDKHTGNTLWNKVAHHGVPKVKRHLKGTHANPTPASNGKYVVAFFGSEGLYCYDMQGELQWQRDFGTLDSGWFFDASYQWGFASSPIIFEDTVIVQCDIQENSFVAALQLSNGDELWRVSRDEIPSWSTPTVIQTPSGPQLITNATNYARAYDPRTGEELWRIGKHSEIVVPTPFYAHDLVFIASGYRPIKRIFAITPSAQGDISQGVQENASQYVAWSNRNSGPYMVTPVCYGDHLYTCDSRGVFECFDAKTGERIYRKRISNSSATSFVGSLVAADGHIYVPSEEGIMLVIKAGADYEIVAENPLGELMLTTPAISQGVMYLRGQSHLIAVREEASKVPAGQ